MPENQTTTTPTARYVYSDRRTQEFYDDVMRMADDDTYVEPYVKVQALIEAAITVAMENNITVPHLINVMEECIDWATDTNGDTH